MNDDIIRMAREAKITPGLISEKGAYFARIEHLVELARADEREACAKVCEEMRPSKAEYDHRFYTACTLNANAIRARGQG
jgi:hypothetical protein